jgi:hypothetical protein
MDEVDDLNNFLYLAVVSTFNFINKAIVVRQI